MARSLPAVPTFPVPADRSYADAYQETLSQLRADVIAFHDDAIAEDGGVPGLRDEHLLMSALARPFATVGGTLAFPNGLEQAAVLVQSLTQNHAFVDGNKRTAFTTCLYFLQRCGYWSHVLMLTQRDLEHLEDFVLWLANEHADRAQGAPPGLYEPAALARRLHAILAPTRRRRPRLRRLRSQAYRVYWLRPALPSDAPEG